MRLFLLDDDEGLCFGIKTYFEKFGYTVDAVQSLSEAKKVFSYDKYDLIILDVNLEDGTGYDFLKLFNIKNLPVIFLTVNNEEEDIVKGLNLSDGYITKPFKLSILKAKIESVLRRVDISEKDIINYETLVMDLKNYSCTIEGKDADLTVKEFGVLKILLVNMNNTLTRNSILEKVWDINGDFVEDNTLSATVKRLRKKLGKYGDNIETVRGIGYRFTGG